MSQWKREYVEGLDGKPWLSGYTTTRPDGRLAVVDRFGSHFGAAIQHRLSDGDWMYVCCPESRRTLAEAKQDALGANNCGNTECEDCK